MARRERCVREVRAGRLLGALAALFLASGAHAAVLETPARQAYLVDLATGAVLLDKNADVRMPPSSMSKIMTVIMVFEQLRAGHLSLDDTLPVSVKAWREGGSKMFVEVDSRVRVEDLLRGIIVQSGNDASIVIAEGLAGTEAAFAEAMTRRGKELGLADSHFTNASGLPDPDQYTTARDLARLAEITITEYPEWYHYYAEIEFTFNGIRQGNRNPLLYKDIGADGLKTGHTKAAGYGLAASVERQGRRLILVINGLESSRARSREAERLVEWGFRAFNNYTLFAAGETVEMAEVWLGQDEQVPLVIERDLVITLPAPSRADLEVAVRYEGPLPAPIDTGSTVAELVVSAPGFETQRVALVAGADVARLGPVGRIVAAFQHLLWGGPR